MIRRRLPVHPRLITPTTRLAIPFRHAQYASSKTTPKFSADGSPLNIMTRFSKRLPYIFNGLYLGSLCFLMVHITFSYFIEYTGCQGISMLPTFNSFGDAILISKYYRRGRGVQVGDVVSFAHPVNSEDRAIKRVVGMPGDVVCRDTPGVGEGLMVQVRLLLFTVVIRRVLVCV